MKYYVIVAILVLFPLSLSATTTKTQKDGIIKGKVIDEASRVPKRAELIRAMFSGSLPNTADPPRQRRSHTAMFQPGARRNVTCVQFA